jgi:hypothetical protein
MLVMAYTYWRRSIIDGGYATKSLLPTNFPIYLTKAILHETGTFPSVGSIDSLNKPSSANLDWRKMVMEPLSQIQSQQTSYSELPRQLRRQISATT